MKKIFLYILIPALLGTVSCALQSDVIYIDDRVDAIEKKLSKQNITSGDATKDLRTQYARLNNEVEQLEEMIRRMEGRFEEIGFQLVSRKEALDALKKEIGSIGNMAVENQARMNRLAAYTGYESSGDGTENLVAGSDEAKTSEPVAKSDDELLYEKGRTAYEKGDLGKAEKIFREILLKFPGSDLADNAQFGIGECLYMAKDYKQAILEYQTVIEEYPKGNKTAGAYLKQGFSFILLGEPENAKLSLKDLIERYPDSVEAKLAAKKLDTLKK